MTAQEIDRIQNAIRHIKTSVDIDSWAMEIAVEAMEKYSEVPNSSDCISRQEAIDVLKGLPTWWADEGGYYGGAQPPMVALLDPEDAVSAIENLPSAQSEPCGDAVSRQYILDVLDEYIEEYGEVDKEGNHDLKWCAMGEAKMVVKEAPSVQPEIIHCQDCIHAIEDALCGGYWCKGKAVTSDHYCGYAERRTDELGDS